MTQNILTLYQDYKKCITKLSLTSVLPFADHNLNEDSKDTKKHTNSVPFRCSCPFLAVLATRLGAEKREGAPRSIVEKEMGADIGVASAGDPAEAVAAQELDVGEG